MGNLRRMDSGEYGLVCSQTGPGSMSAWCRSTALHLASENGHTESVSFGLMAIGVMGMGTAPGRCRLAQSGWRCTFGNRVRTGNYAAVDRVLCSSHASSRRSR
jgi:hypothetical protein